MLEIVQKPSPNFSSGRSGFKPEAIVIHVMDGSLVGTDSWFANPVSQVSSHYGIGKKGEVHQYVQEENTAWANGRILDPSWPLIKPNVNPNVYTISIEHEGYSTSVWSEEMKRASAQVIKAICCRWKIPLDRDHVIGHYQIFSGKPDCPARDKQIIKELITLASGEKEVVEEIQSLLRRAGELLDLLK